MVNWSCQAGKGNRPGQLEGTMDHTCACGDEFDGEAELVEDMREMNR
jgi:hypothetical protein